MCVVVIVVVLFLVAEQCFGAFVQHCARLVANNPADKACDTHLRPVHTRRYLPGLSKP